MVFLTIAWAGLILICFLIGTGVLNFTKAGCFEEIGDRFIVSTWLGVITLSVALLTTSIIFPLSPSVGVVVAVSVAAAAMMSYRTTTEITALYAVISSDVTLKFFCINFSVAALAARPVRSFDTGLYHFQAIQWLSRFGAVPGLALIHNRFGFTSSWFGLVAPFNDGIFEARTSTLLGGFILVLFTFHYLIKIEKIFRRSNSFESWFIVVSSSLILAIFLATKGLSFIVLSNSPDVPIILITIVVMWTILIIQNSKKNSSTTSRSKLIPLILSAGAVTIKLSALPLLVISSLFYVFNENEKKIRVWPFFIPVAISFLLLSPLFTFNIITSGCPLYPSSVSCFNFPWSLDTQDVKAMSELIQVTAQTSSPNPFVFSQNSLFQWLVSEKIFVCLLILSILSVVYLFQISKKYYIPGQSWLLVGGCFGSGFIMYTAPTLRFGLGYLVILPSSVISLYCNKHSFDFFSKNLLSTKLKSDRLILFLVLILASLCMSTGLLWKSPYQLKVLAAVKKGDVSSSLKSQSQFLLPPNLQNLQWVHQSDQGDESLEPFDLELMHKQVNDVAFTMPKVGSNCWAAELPCTPEFINKDTKLRNPKRGIGAGFIRKNSMI